MTNNTNIPADKILETLPRALCGVDSQKPPILVVTLTEDGWVASISWGLEGGVRGWISDPCDTLEKAAMDLVERVHTDMVATATASSLELN